MYKRVSLLALLLVLLISIGVTVAQDDNPAFDYEQYTLENGLEVILIEDHSAPTVAVDVWYKVGGANDPEGRSGFAHLFEHMMFQGSANIEKGELDRLVTAAGGGLNAFTATDVTGYYEVLPSHQLPLGLWLEADRMSSLAINQVNLDNQRAVVIEEFQLRYGNSPYGKAILELFTIAFDYTPYETAPIGSIADLNAATVEEIRDFHATYYVPNNATLVVAGDIDVEQTKELINQFFAPIPAQAEPPTLPEYTPIPQNEAEIITLEDSLISIPGVFIGYETPSRQHPDYAAVEIVTHIMSTGDSSRLAQTMLDTGLALVADTVVLDNSGPSLFGVLMLPNFTTSVEAVEEAFYGELEKMRTEGVDDAELEKAINAIVTSRTFGLETAFGLAESVQEANFYFGSPDAVFGEIERFNEVTSEDIQRVITEYLAPEDRHIIYVNPGEGQPANDPEPFVGATDEDSADEIVSTYILEQSEPPEPLPINEFNLPTITETELDNGLEVIVIEKRDIPIVSLDVYFRGGQSKTEAENAGVDDFVAYLLTRGTENRSAQEIAGAIEQVGGGMGSGASNDNISIGIYSLTKDAELAFELLGDSVLNPIFPEQEIEVYRENLITSLESNLSDPSALVNRAFTRLVYGEHPYGNLVTQESLESITRDGIIDYYNRQNNPKNAVLIIAGDISADEALKLAERTFGDWQGEHKNGVHQPDELGNPSEIQIYLVDVPGATQAEIIIGGIGVYGDYENRSDLQVMNTILGSGFSSRLFQNIREEKGYSYSIGSGFTYPVYQGIFRVSSAVRNDVVEAAITEILRELDRIRTEPVTDEELQRTRGGMIGRYALSLETYQAFVEQIASLKLRGLSLDELNTYPERIGSVDENAILNGASSFIPETPYIVVAGDASLIQEALENIAPVTLLEPQ